MESLGSPNAQAAQKCAPERDAEAAPRDYSHTGKLDAASSHLLSGLHICRGGKRRDGPCATTREGTCSGSGETERFKDMLQGLGKVQGSEMRGYSFTMVKSA